VLVLNAGSSSLKASLVRLPDTTLGRLEVAWGSDATRMAGREAGVRSALERLGLPPGTPAGGSSGAGRGLLAVGHRVVHGGRAFVRPTLLDERSVAAIEAVRDLAPLHNGVALEVIAQARGLLPGVPHVACFDTSFHATLPEEAWRYPVPERWYREWGVRRFGFHGLSVAWATERAATLLGRPIEDLAIVVAHLGSGCSVTGVLAGRSVDTSMGLTPLEGLMMSTRSGSIDPGILLRLLEDERVALPELADTLDHGSGLLAVSGLSGDVREVSSAADAGDERARLALAMFERRAAAGIAGAAVALPRLDALVFTGGIGERAAGVRAGIVGRLGVLGVAPLPPTPPDAQDDVVLSAAGQRPAVLRVTAREDLVIAREAAAVARA
jgi:acetate kinase